jgi:hypothetical protein
MFGSKMVVKSQVWLAGLQAYAESEGEQRLSAQVEITEMKSRPFCASAAGNRWASRLFSTLRVEPEYTEPFMDLIEEVHSGLEEAENPSEFRVYDHVGDPVLWNWEAGSSPPTSRWKLSSPNSNTSLLRPPRPARR